MCYINLLLTLTLTLATGQWFRPVLTSQTEEVIPCQSNATVRALLQRVDDLKSICLWSSESCGVANQTVPCDLLNRVVWLKASCLRGDDDQLCQPCIHVCLSVCLSVSVCQSACLPACDYVCQSVRQSVCDYVCLCVCVCVSRWRRVVLAWPVPICHTLMNCRSRWLRAPSLVRAESCPDTRYCLSLTLTLALTLTVA